MKKRTYSLFSFLLVGVASLFILGCEQASIESEPKSTSPLAMAINENMVLVKGGTFTMGSDSEQASYAEKPAHTVTVKDFYISQFEVTQELYHKVMGPSLTYFPNPQNPINNISWKRTHLFIEKLNELTGENYRLPTEAEWEFAAKGGTKSQSFTYSGSNNIDDVAWYANNSENQVHLVGQKQPNELGLYDMTGNVGEWVVDAYDRDFYKTSPSDNPVNAKDSPEDAALKTVRGASFAYPAKESENFRRDFASQSIVMADIGIRLAKDYP